MKILEIILSLIDKNLNMILLWFYNKKVDEVKKLETDIKVIKEETEIKTKKEKFEEALKTSSAKVLDFQKALKEFRDKKKNK